MATQNSFRHEGHGAGVRATFQHALSRMMKSVRGPRAIPAIADLWADVRIDMEPPAIKNLPCNRLDLRGVFRGGPADFGSPDLPQNPPSPTSIGR
jgi:hypothetical protein